MRVAAVAALILAVVATAGLEVRDWNDRPLTYGTVAVYDGGRLVAITYVINGAAAYGLPWRPWYTLRVAWGVAALDELASGRVIWIYDSSVARDVAELGAPTSGKVRTWAFPVTITVRDRWGRPLAGCYAKVVDALTGGRWLSVFATTASDGSVSLFQAPATDYYVYVYCGQIMAATAKFSIQRGSPATAWNYEITVDYIETVKVSNAP
ncbi:hypothetical protein Pogu_1255 [Pyrobaculum oguniense TE7]|uniref:Carboxypeptidase regulatory-like domain-containing protein n=1 Tax=Pyrobaculum oguniense (strain DSM 13380 / JCM 10595 / TE7) TaxID=698757 RepID=H6QA81_PYROT|nr:hypothetical protein Pogu_1255 [Pyrobaculum oguniense TE7]